jgi:hypothetical protein
VAILLVALVALGGGGAIVLGLGPKLGLIGGGPSPDRPAPTAEPTPATATPAEEMPPAPPEAAEDTPSVAAPSEPSPSASAAPASSAEGAPAETPEQGPEAAASASAETPAPAVPTTPVSEFDISTLPSERAALYVRSSATARVFVHGTDYGETNQVLVTTCGIRFVRLGRSLGDFIEPGRSHVIKCGRLTEIAIEPER